MPDAGMMTGIDGLHSNTGSVASLLESHPIGLIIDKAQWKR